MTIHLPVPGWIVDIETLGGSLNNVGERGIDQPRFIVSVSSLSIIIASQNLALVQRTNSSRQKNIAIYHKKWAV